jgi:serine protease Do
MNTDTHAYEWIERYLSGTLHGEELRNFELRLANEPQLAEQVRTYTQLRSALARYNTRLSLKKRLENIHRSLDLSNLEGYRPPMQYALKNFWRKHSTTISVAASVALLTAFGTSLSTGSFSLSTKPVATHYRELRRDVESIKRAQKAIVQNINKRGSRPAPRLPQFSGTGFALSQNGYLVTSYHVIREADSLMIESQDGRQLKVETVYEDPSHDLALLRVVDTAFTSFGRLPYAFSKGETDLGERVFTLGYPREDVVYGEGSVSAVTGFQNDSTAYQVSIPVNPGNSGGPLLDERGNLIGVISGKQTDTEGAAFAVKSSYLLGLIEAIEKDTLQEKVKLPRTNLLAGQRRTQQLRKLRDYVYIVRVYN